MKIFTNNWPRIVEIILALALIVSPATVGGSISIDVACGVAILLLVILSKVSHRLRRIYLLELAIAALLLLSGYIQSFPEPLPVTQHRMIIGLLILMFAIIPHPAAKPPQAWQKILAS